MFGLYMLIHIMLVDTTNFHIMMKICGVNSNFPGCLITPGILYPDVFKYDTEKYVFMALS